MANPRGGEGQINQVGEICQGRAEILLIEFSLRVSRVGIMVVVGLTDTLTKTSGPMSIRRTT